MLKKEVEIITTLEVLGIWVTLVTSIAFYK